MSFLLIWLIKVYQNTLGILFRGNCRFHPTCSEYMLQAIKKYGPSRGVIKGFSKNNEVSPLFKKFWNR